MRCYHCKTVLLSSRSLCHVPQQQQLTAGVSWSQAGTCSNHRSCGHRESPNGHSGPWSQPVLHGHELGRVTTGHCFRKGKGCVRSSVGFVYAVVYFWNKTASFLINMGSLHVVAHLWNKKDGLLNQCLIYVQANGDPTSLGFKYLDLKLHFCPRVIKIQE